MARLVLTWMIVALILASCTGTAGGPQADDAPTEVLVTIAEDQVVPTVPEQEANVVVDLDVENEVGEGLLIITVDGKRLQRGSEVHPRPEGGHYPLWLSPGTHEVRASLEGYPADQLMFGASEDTVWVQVRYWGPESDGSTSITSLYSSDDRLADF